MAQPKLYALLIGIDQYQAPRLAVLSGCVNDVNALEQLLRDKFNVPAENIKKLTNTQATHQAIKDAFKSHLIGQAQAWSKAGRSEPVPAFLFHYSGHGSQAPAKPGTKPDDLDETIVPHDSRVNDVYDIKDWELGRLIDELNRYTENITIILDCCHSGSGTRDINDQSIVAARRCEPDLRPQPPHPDVGPVARTRSITPSGWLLGEKHVLLAGCRSRELANEYHAPEGLQHGVLTYFLLKELAHLSHDQLLTYRELHEAVRGQVNRLYINQMPQCEGDRDRLVFGGLRPSRDIFLKIIRKGEGYLWVDGGVAHGLTAGSQLRVYSPGTRRLAEAGTLLATLVIAEVGAVQSGCTVEESTAAIEVDYPVAVYRLNHGDMQKRVVLNLPAGELLTAVQHRLAQPDVAPYLRLVAPDTTADFRVQRVKDKLEIQDGAGKLLVAPFPLDKWSTPDNDLGRDLVHLVRYQNGLALQNTAGHSELAGMVTVVVKTLAFDDRQEPIAVPIEPSPGGEILVEVGQRIVLEVSDHAPVDLYLAVFDFSYDWEVKQLYPRMAGSHELLKAGKTYSLGLSRDRRNQLAAQLPPGISEVRQYIKVIATITDADFEVLQQPPLKTPFQTRGALPRGGKPASALSALLAQAMAGGYTRAALGPLPASIEDEWTTAQIEFHLVQPIKTVTCDLPGSVVTTLPGYDLKLEAPAGFQGQARLLTQRQVTRASDGDSTDLLPPPGLAAFGRLFQRVELPSHGAREVAPSGTVIEIEADETARQRVTEATPLKLFLPEVMTTAGEATMALAYDGSFFYPVGRPGETANTVNIEWLPEAAPPEEEAIRTRNLGRTVKLYLFKMASWPEPSLGLHQTRFVPGNHLEEEYPQSDERCYPVAGGEVRYRKLQPGDLQTGQRVALFVHGFTSETRWMVAGIAPWLEAQGIHYNHTLTFDYETFNTRIGQNGQILAKALCAAGFGPRDKIHLDVFAHSMGTQVVRSMVEQHGGDQFVNRCFLAGPPNQGTRLAELKRLIPWLGTLLLNQAGPIPPTIVASWVLKKVSDDAVGGDDLRPGSDFFKQLNESDQPARVPYYILAGRHDLPTAYKNVWDRVVKTLVGAADAGLDLLFGDQHDMVINVQSMLTVRNGNYPAKLLYSRVLPCNHFDYFADAEGQQQLLKWLGPA